MQLNNLRIGTRLGGGFAIVLALLLATLVAGGVVNSKNSDRMILELNTASGKIMQANAMRTSLLAAGIAMRNIGMLSEVSAMEKENANVTAKRQRYEEARGKLSALGLNGEQEKIIADIARLDAQIEGLLKQALGQAVAFNSEGAGRTLTAEIDPLNQRALAAIDQLVEGEQAASARILEDSVKSAQRLQYFLYAISTLAMMSGAICAWLITRSIINPLRGAVEMASQVAAGDLTSRVTVTGADEISDVLRALKNMADSLMNTVSAVRSGTEAIFSASRDIASGNADLSARTESQASSLAETASSMGQLTSTVKQNADNARQANELVISASTVALQGGAVVGQVVATMGSIKASSSKIVDIIGVIDGIAFQTNILALNAAVEAARAGEQGRGFAVVASEVRNLAQRSAGAAKEIKALISDSAQQVEQGSKLVGDAGQAMEKIVDSVQGVADIMARISAASAQQSAGIEEINQAIGEMDTMTQQNAALVEQAAAAAEGMQVQAQQLSEAISAFRLSDQAPAGAVKPALTAAARPVALKPAVKSKPKLRVAAPAAKRAAASPKGEDQWEEF